MTYHMDERKCFEGDFGGCYAIIKMRDAVNRAGIKDADVRHGAMMELMRLSGEADIRANLFRE